MRPQPIRDPETKKSPCREPPENRLPQEEPADGQGPGSKSPDEEHAPNEAEGVAMMTLLVATALASRREVSARDVSQKFWRIGTNEGGSSMPVIMSG